jgi:hypothetical protein
LDPFDQFDPGWWHVLKDPFFQLSDLGVSLDAADSDFPDQLADGFTVDVTVIDGFGELFERPLRSEPAQLGGVFWVDLDQQRPQMVDISGLCCDQVVSSRGENPDGFEVGLVTPPVPFVSCHCTSHGSRVAGVCFASSVNQPGPSGQPGRDFPHLDTRPYQHRRQAPPITRRSFHTDQPNVFSNAEFAEIRPTISIVRHRNRHYFISDTINNRSSDRVQMRVATHNR